MWLDIVSEIAEKVLITVTPIIAGMIAAWLVKLISQADVKLREMVGEEWKWALDTAASMAVRAAEQMKITGLIEDKKDFAVATVEAYLDEHGLKVDLSLVEVAIEAAVNSYFPKSAE